MLNILVWTHNSGRILKEDVGPASLLETCSSDRIRKTCESLNSLQLPGHNRDSLGLGKVPFPPHVKLTARGGAKIITSTCSRTTFCAIGIVRHGLAPESGGGWAGQEFDPRFPLRCSHRSGGTVWVINYSGREFTSLHPQHPHPAGMSQCSPADANYIKVG